MGFWNVKARDLREGDEIRLTVVGGEEFVTVQKVQREEDSVRVAWEWGLHVPNADTVEDLLPADERLTVRR